MPGYAWSSTWTWSAETTSPPVSTSCTPANACTSWPTRSWNQADVSRTLVIACSTRNRRSDAGEDVLAPRRRDVELEGDVRGPGSEDGREDGNELGRPVERDDDVVARRHASVREPRRIALDRLSELAVRQPSILVDDRLG